MLCGRRNCMPWARTRRVPAKFVAELGRSWPTSEARSSDGDVALPLGFGFVRRVDFGSLDERRLFLDFPHGAFGAGVVSRCERQVHDMDDLSVGQELLEPGDFVGRSVIGRVDEREAAVLGGGLLQGLDCGVAGRKRQHQGHRLRRLT